MGQVTQFFQPPLYWQQFEDLTQSVVELAYGAAMVNKIGRPGQAQDGVDIYAARTRAGAIGVQCKRLTAQIVVKQNGRIVHREAKTLDRKQAAYAWLEKREKELKAPGGLDRKDDVPFRKVIARYLDESEGSMGRTKAAYLKKIMESDLGSINCSEMTSDKLVAFSRTLPVKPQTRANYFSHLSPIFAIATPAWKYPLSKQEFENALESMKRLKLIGKSAERDRRPTLAELDRLMEHFAGRRTDSAPMQTIIAFAIFSTRRQEEITRLQWDDLEDDRILVRAMKDPKNKQQNNVRCELTPEALQIINSMPRVESAICRRRQDPDVQSRLKGECFIRFRSEELSVDRSARKRIVVLIQVVEGCRAIAAFTLYNRSHSSMPDFGPKTSRDRYDMNRFSVRLFPRVVPDVVPGVEKWEKTGRKRAKTSGLRQAKI